MLRQSEIDLVLELEQEMGQRRRHGHFGLDAYHVIGPQGRPSPVSHKKNKNKSSKEPHVKPFIEEVCSNGQLIYKHS